MNNRLIVFLYEFKSLIKNTFNYVKDSYKISRFSLINKNLLEKPSLALNFSTIEIIYSIYSKVLLNSCLSMDKF